MALRIPQRLKRLKEWFKRKTIEWFLFIGVLILIGLYYLTIFRIRRNKDSEDDPE